MKKGYLLAAAAAALLTAACSSEFLRAQEAGVRDKLQHAREAQAVSDRTVEQAQTLKVPSVVVSEKTYLGVKQVPLSTAPKPPAFLSRRVQIAQDVRTIYDVADTLSSISKVPVVITDDARKMALSVAKDQKDQVPAAPPSGPGGGASQQPSGAIALNYSGPLAGLLDLAATRFGVSWRYLHQTGVIEFFLRETRTYPIMVLPGSSILQTDVGTSGSGASGAGSSSRNATQSSKTTVNADFWKDLESSIKAIMTKDAGATISVSPSAGTVTVTDVPDALDRIGSLVEAHNALLTKQVLLDVKVVNLTLKDTEQLGIDWALVYTGLSGNKLSASALGFAQAPTTNPSSFSFNVLDGRKFNGSTGILQALSQQAHIGAVTSAQQFALNNQATPIQVGQNSRYIESTTVQVQQNLPPIVTATTNMISSGVALQLLPRILDNQNLLIHFSVDISDEPENLPPDSKWGVSLYSQNVRNFMQRVSLRTGETLVLSGYEKNTNSVKKRGLATPDNPLFGGGRDSEGKREIIVIMITPVIMDRVRS